VSAALFSTELSPRSAITLLGSYGINLYDDNALKLNNSYEVGTAAQYGYVLSPRSTIGFLVGYRYFKFPSNEEGTLSSTVAQVTYRRIISRRTSLSVGAGPQFARTKNQIEIPIFTPPLVLNLKSSQVNTSAFVSAGHTFKQSSASLSYQRLITTGSGLFQGANTNAVQFSLSPRLFHTWSTSVNAGYVSLQEIQKNLKSPTGGSYQYGYFGAAMSRRIGRSFSFTASYQFNDDFGSANCGSATGCVGSQSTLTVGLVWHARAVRADESMEKNPDLQPDSGPSGAEEQTNPGEPQND